MLSMFPTFRRPLPLGLHETAASLLARHAAQLGLHGAAIICQDLGVRWADVVSGDVRLVTDLAKAAHVSSDDLVRWSPVQTPEGVRVGHETIPKSLMSLQLRRFCPLCLKDDLSRARGRPDLAVFGRGSWHIPFLPLCETHHVALVEPAPSSEEDVKADFIQWIRPVLPDLGRWIRQAVECPPSDCDAYLFARLNGKAPSRSLLDGLSLPVIARACEELGRDLVPMREDVLTTDDVPTLQTARHHGFRMLAAGPGELSAYFDQRLDKVGSENLSGSSLTTLYGNLYRWVSKQTDPDLDPIRDGIADHAFANLPLAAGSSICCRTLQNRRRHTIRSAAADFRSTQLMMRTWLVAEEILAGPASQLVENTMIPDTPEAAAFLDKAADAFTHRQVLLRLKINSHQMDDLIADGLIRPLFPSIADTTQNAYSRTQLAALVERLFQGPAISLTPDAPDIAYSRVTQVATLAHCAFHDVIRLLLATPKIRGFRRRGEPGIRALYLLVEDIETAIHRAKLPGLTPWRFAQNLEITQRTLEQLITLGVIWTKCVPHPALKNPVPIIPNACIRAFERRYISLQAFADRRGRHWIGQQKLLNAHGIDPVYDGRSPRSRFYEQAAIRHMMRW